MNPIRTHSWLVCAAFAALLGGCAAHPSASMSDAVYAGAVPVYQGARFSESMGNESWGDDPGSYTRGESWHFETAASRQALLAFYEKKYPQARKTELDSGSIELRLVPEGAQPFEDVTIVIGDHELTIGENVRPDTRERFRNQHVRPATTGRFQAPPPQSETPDDPGSDAPDDDSES